MKCLYIYILIGEKAQETSLDNNVCACTITVLLQCLLKDRWMGLPSLFTFSVQFTCVHGYLPVAKLLFHTLSPIPVSDFSIIICTVQSSLSYI